MTLDFDSDDWRNDMIQQQRIKFMAAETHEEQRAVADVLLVLHRGKEAAQARRDGQ